MTTDGIYFTTWIIHKLYIFVCKCNIFINNIPQKIVKLSKTPIFH